jgi:hypothetical protein
MRWQSRVRDNSRTSGNTLRDCLLECNRDVDQYALATKNIRQLWLRRKNIANRKSTIRLINNSVDVFGTVLTLLDIRLGAVLSIFSKVTRIIIDRNREKHAGAVFEMGRRVRKKRYDADTGASQE